MIELTLHLPRCSPRAFLVLPAAAWLTLAGLAGAR